MHISASEGIFRLSTLISVKIAESVHYLFINCPARMAQSQEGVMSGEGEFIRMRQVSLSVLNF